LPKNTHFEELFYEFGYRNAPIYLTSENAAVLPLQEQNDDLLLANMRKTTRYLVNKAIKEGVTINIDTTGKKIQEFMQLYNVTTAREGFIGFGESYIKSEFEAFGRYNNAVILNANHKAQNLASALILFTKNAAFYHQGASNHPKVPAPYLLQWRAIQLAIERGCKYYNFWGTYIPGRTPKSWQGLTLFKLGFGTQIWNYLPTYDYPLSPSYHLTNIYERFIRIKRGV
jgi:lipid II:glycine glycyltransferase (peptidoglycan interpeptide bridge formation enzyme)